MLKLGGSGQIVIGEFAIQLPDRIAEHAHIGVLQTGGEALTVGALVEEVQDAIELGS